MKISDIKLTKRELELIHVEYEGCPSKDHQCVHDKLEQLLFDKVDSDLTHKELWRLQSRWKSFCHPVNENIKNIKRIVNKLTKALHKVEQQITKNKMVTIDLDLRYLGKLVVSKRERENSQDLSLYYHIQLKKNYLDVSGELVSFLFKIDKSTLDQIRNDVEHQKLVNEQSDGQWQGGKEIITFYCEVVREPEYPLPLYKYHDHETILVYGSVLEEMPEPYFELPM